MPVWSEGETVRGYKADQFSDAFAQLGVRSVRDVRGEARSDTAPNTPNAPNTSAAELIIPEGALVECVICGESYALGESGSGPVSCPTCVDRREHEPPALPTEVA
jgi:hypothetical protein